MINKDFYMTIGAIIIANLIALLGMVFFDWSMLQTILIYWAESVIFVFYNNCKIIFSRLKPSIKITALIFTTISYVIFLTIHYIFLNVIFNNKIIAFNPNLFFPILIPIIFIFISHGISFIKNYIGRGEYTKLTTYDNVSEINSSILKRIVTEHSCLMVGGAAVLYINQPTIGIVLLIVIKTIIDIDFHLKSYGGNGLFQKQINTFKNIGRI